MRFRMMATGVAPIGALALICHAALAEGPPPATSGVYTPAQAEAGKAVYEQNCAACHGPALEGGAGPVLKGPAFKELAAAQGLTADTLLTVVATTMPQSSPGSLTPEDYAAVVAFVLQQNGYPGGPDALAPNSAKAAALKLGS